MIDAFGCPSLSQVLSAGWFQPFLLPHLSGIAFFKSMGNSACFLLILWLLFQVWGTEGGSSAKK